MKIIRSDRLLLVLLSLVLLVSCKDENAPGKDWKITPQQIAAAIEKGSAVHLHHEKAVNRFYEARSNHPAWAESEDRAELFSALSGAEKEGLSGEDYHLPEIKQLMQRTSFTPQEAARLDLLLTDAFLTFSEDLYYGKLDPREYHDDWGVPKKDIDLLGFLQKAAESGDVDEAFNQIRPHHQVYEGLMRSLEDYAALRKNQEHIVQVPEGEMIKPGEKDPRIPILVQRLKQLELLPDDYQSRDSTFTRDLQDAVERFQKTMGLETDAVLGNSTLGELNMSVADRYDQILVNLERWRWYPRNLGDHYILVNIPDFNLVVVKDGDTLRQHNVVAGAPARQTPIFSDTLQYIVINPTWTVPPTIKAQDVIPKASRNPEYLKSHNMVVYDAAGNRLSPGEIDWGKAANYTFVQRSGVANPLGRVKIIYPNRYLVYLHDTPSKGLFEENERAESSGCVRVENAVELAAYAISGQDDWNEEKIREVIGSGKTTQVKINRPISVHHFYWTAWRAGDKTVFTNDVYGLDQKILKGLKQGS